MDTFPVLHTKRLTIRKLGIADVPLLVKYANNKKIAGHILNIPYPYQEPDAVFRISYVHQGFKNKTHYVFAIEYNEAAQFIGEISLHVDSSQHRAQLAYWIGEPFWNKGLTTEATAAILQFGFQKLNLNMIYAECHVENKASEKVLLNNYMKRQGSSGNIVQYQLSKQMFE